VDTGTEFGYIFTATTPAALLAGVTATRTCQFGHGSCVDGLSRSDVAVEAKDGYSTVCS
jgi:hypothetical protein